MRRFGLIAIGLWAACGSSDAGVPDGLACAPFTAPRSREALVFTGHTPTTFALVEVDSIPGATTTLEQVDAQSDRGFGGLAWSSDGSRAATFDQDQWMFSFRTGEPAFAPLASASAWIDTSAGGQSPFSPSGCFVAELTFDGALVRRDNLVSGGLAPPLTIADQISYARWAPATDRIAYVRGTGASQAIGVMDEHGATQEWPVSDWSLGLWWIDDRWVVAQLGDPGAPSGVIAIDTQSVGKAPIAIRPSSPHVRFDGASPYSAAFVVTDVDTNIDTIVTLDASVHAITSAHHFARVGRPPQFFDSVHLVAQGVFGLVLVSLTDDSENLVSPGTPIDWIVPWPLALWRYGGGTWTIVENPWGVTGDLPCIGDPIVAPLGDAFACNAPGGAYVLADGIPGVTFSVDGDPGTFHASFAPDGGAVEFDHGLAPHFYSFGPDYVPAELAAGVTAVSWRPMAAQ